jgi:hypothetical protein
MRAGYGISPDPVGWVRPEAVTHQGHATGMCDNWPVMTIEEIADVNPRVDKAAIPNDLPVSFVTMPGGSQVCAKEVWHCSYN